MKLATDVDAARSRRRVTRRATALPSPRYPNTSIIRLYRGPLAKLAWIFGFRPRPKSASTEI